MGNFGVQFFIVPLDHPKVRYQHESISLCEGLRELGIACTANHSYWKYPETNTYLLRPQEIGTADVHVYNVYYFWAYPEAIKQVDYTKVNILIDREDGIYGSFNDSQFERFDLILRAQYNRHIPYHRYHSNIQPWAFGLSHRIIEVIDRTRKHDVGNRTGQTYRVGHTLRELASQLLSPHLQTSYPVKEWISLPIEEANPDKLKGVDLFYWQQSGRRHDPDYYQFLNESRLTYAFGGLIFFKPYLTSRLQKPWQWWHQWQYQRKRAQGKPVERHVILDQFDSWRWWEALYSNSIPIHMDFDYWGWQLPVQPLEGEHYLGVKDLDFDTFAERLQGLEEEDFARIAKAGREWCIRHYSPSAVAMRFLDHLALLSNKRGMHELAQKVAEMTLISNQKPQ